MNMGNHGESWRSPTMLVGKKNNGRHHVQVPPVERRASSFSGYHVVPAPLSARTARIAKGQAPPSRPSRYEWRARKFQAFGTQALGKKEFSLAMDLNVLLRTLEVRRHIVHSRTDHGHQRKREKLMVRHMHSHGSCP